MENITLSWHCNWYQWASGRHWQRKSTIKLKESCMAAHEDRDKAYFPNTASQRAVLHRSTVTATYSACVSSQNASVLYIVW